jgi:Tfp pilus assembly pilus retraction ATPase PilT
VATSAADELGTMSVTVFLRHMVEAGASDLHLKAGLPPVIRVDSVLRHAPFAPLRP